MYGATLLVVLASVSWGRYCYVKFPLSIHCTERNIYAIRNTTFTFPVDCELCHVFVSETLLAQPTQHYRACIDLWLYSALVNNYGEGRQILILILYFTLLFRLCILFNDPAMDVFGKYRLSRTTGK